jgi:hypothetical protein
MNKIFFSALFVVLTIFGSACTRQPETNAPQETTPAQTTPTATPLVGFERDLQFIRNGQYTYVFVFSRKDGKALDKDDSAILRKNAPQVVDWVMTDGGKKVIGGTNFNLEEGGMAELRKKFVVEDYSKK